MCNAFCKDFEKETCKRLLKPPYVCNGWSMPALSQPWISIFPEKYATVHAEWRAAWKLAKPAGLDALMRTLKDIFWNILILQSPSWILWQGNIRTRIFYCDPSAPYQKGSAERNHEFIRCFLPKGTDLAPYSQEDICLMMCFLFCMGRRFWLFLGATKFLPRTWHSIDPFFTRRTAMKADRIPLITRLI